MKRIHYTDANGKHVAQRHDGTIIVPRTHARSNAKFPKPDYVRVLKLREQRLSYGLIAHRMGFKHPATAFYIVKRMAPGLVSAYALYTLKDGRE